MENHFILQIDEKASLNKRLNLLRKLAIKLKSEIKKTEEAIKNEEIKNPKQLDLEDESNRITNTKETNTSQGTAEES